MAAAVHLARRYEVTRRGESAGQVYVGFPHFLDPGSKTNPAGAVTLLYRESDGTRADQTERWGFLRELPGRVRIEFDHVSRSWRAAGPRSKPAARAKRFQPSR